MQSAEASGKQVVVIGSGIGGTALTLLLSHMGFAVTLLEKNTQLGGACAGYEKQGFQVDFSTHMFSRGDRGPLGEVLRRTENGGAIEFLRTRDILEFRYPARDGSGRVERVPFPAQVHRWPLLAMGLARAMRLNPADALRATRLVVDLMTMSDARMQRWMYRSVDDYLSQFSDNPNLLAALRFLLTLFFVIPPSEASAGEAIYCLQRMLRDNALSYPAGGSKTIPLTYTELAQRNGADVRVRAGVEKILITNGKVRGVLLRDGSILGADIVVSTSGVRDTILHLCDPNDFPAPFVQSARAVQGSLAGVQIKIGLDKKLVHSGCLMGAVGEGKDLFKTDAGDFDGLFAALGEGRMGPITGFYCPVTTNFDPSLAPPGHQLLTFLIGAPPTNVQLHDRAEEWEERALATARAIVPGLDDHITFVDRTTTHWMEHWLGKETGPAVSTAQNVNQVGVHRPSVNTPIAGLYLAGDNAGGRGVGTELAADSAMECAERIMADLRMPLPTSWHTDRHKQPKLTRIAAELFRPSAVV